MYFFRILLTSKQSIIKLKIQIFLYGHSVARDMELEFQVVLVKVNFFSSCNFGIGDDESCAFMNTQRSENMNPVTGPRIRQQVIGIMQMSGLRKWM